MISQYVAGFFFNEGHSRVILIEKKRPSWQTGLLNGVGGKVEQSDPDSTYAMRREFEEETGINTEYWNWKQFARLQGPVGPHSKLVEFVVDWFWSFGPMATHAPAQTTDERPSWYVLDELFACPELMIPNLRWLLPMAMTDIERRDSCSLFTVTETEKRP